MFLGQVPVIATQDIFRFMCSDQHTLDQAFNKTMDFR